MPTAAAKNYTQSVGRRKEAVARVRLTPGSGLMTINGKPLNEAYPGLIHQKTYQKPFEITKTIGEFAMSAKVVGGGPVSQLQAIVHGASRALAKLDAGHRGVLKSAGLLTRDSRVRERRKYGLAHAARAKKQSPKR